MPVDTQEALGAWVFLRLLGLAHLVAFGSLAVQWRGLFGRDGISPAVKLAEAAAPDERWRLAPSLFWIEPTDRTIAGLIYGGLALAALLTIGVAPAPALLGLWAAYLSLCSIGGRFLSFQWDTLLIETTFAALLVTPWRLLPATVDPSPWGVWILRLLTFRLMFFAGYVKLASGDPTWRSLTALAYHYETQPLPNPLSRWFHHRPPWFHKAGAAFNFFVELVVPFGIFFPALRPVAALAFVALMGLLELTGNFGFFQLLSVAPCALLVPDELWAKVLPAGLLTVWPHVVAPDHRTLWLSLLGVPLLLAAIAQAMSQLDGGLLPDVVRRAMRAVAPLRTVNPYGLFAVMTTERPELVFEGSDDGVTWKEYVLRYKPGPLDRVPPVVAPHMPRLDWQLWFAALSMPERWVFVLMDHLLRGTPEVVRMFQVVPFEKPPKYVRASLYDYRFSPPGSKDVWVRRFIRPYGPPLTRPD